MEAAKAGKRGRRAAHLWVTIRLWPEEKNRLVEQASLAGLSLAEYSRRRIFGGRPIISRGDRAIITELRQLGGLLKGHFNLLRQHGASQSIFEVMENTLRHLSWAIQKLGMAS